MNVSREFAKEQLALVRERLGHWVDEIDKPTDESGALIYPEGVPKGMTVSELGIDADQARAELVALAGILEAIAVSQ